MEAPKDTRKLAKQLRRSLTLPEGLLWRAIKGGQLMGLHFRKQHPVGPYVLDFYCDALKLCVEVDGQAHSAGARPSQDEFRDFWLAERGVHTVRLNASLILEDLDAAINTIRAAARL